jgi:hypothetical protein
MMVLGDFGGPMCETRLPFMGLATDSAVLPSRGKKVANVIPVDHGAIRHRGGRLPKLAFNTSNSNSICVALAVIMAHTDNRGPIPNGRHQSSQLAPVVQPDQFRTTDVLASALNA